MLKKKPSKKNGKPKSVNPKIKKLTPVESNVKKRRPKIVHRNKQKEIPPTTHTGTSTSFPSDIIFDDSSTKKNETGFAKDMKDLFFRKTDSFEETVKRHREKTDGKWVAPHIPKKSEPTTDELVKELKIRVTSLEHELENKLPGYHGYKNPISITVLNVSDKTIENVPLFNYKYKNQHDIIYNAYFHDGYDDVLKFKSAIGIGEGNEKIGMVTVSSNSLSMFLLCHATRKTMDGVSISIPLPFVIDPNQMQSCILAHNRKIHYDVGTNIVIQSLPPMTKFMYSIYLISEDYEKRMENLKQKINLQP